MNVFLFNKFLLEIFLKTHTINMLFLIYKKIVWDWIWGEFMKIQKKTIINSFCRTESLVNISFIKIYSSPSPLMRSKNE